MHYHSYNDYELTIIDVAETKQPLKTPGGIINKVPALASEAEEGGWIISDDLSDIENLRATFGFKTNKW